MPDRRHRPKHCGEFVRRERVHAPRRLGGQRVEQRAQVDTTLGELELVSAATARRRRGPRARKGLVVLRCNIRNFGAA